MRRGAGEAMAEGDIAVRRDTHETDPRAARIGLAHSLVNLLERVAHIREAMATPRERRLEILPRQRLKAREQRLKALVFDRVLTLPARRHGREADLPEADLLEEMTIDRDDVEILPGQRHARAHRLPAVTRQQLLDPRQNQIVAAQAIREDAELVLLLPRPVDRNRHANVVRDDPVDDLLAQQRGVCRQAGVYLFA